VLYLLVISLGALILCYTAVAGIRSWALRRNVLDIPNERSSHTQPTPRGGGLAIAVIVLLAFVLIQLLGRGLASRAFFGYFTGALLIGAISGIDDLFAISAKIRLPVHFIAALLFALIAGFVQRIYLPFFGDLNLGWAGLPLTVVWIAGFTNAFNFMDGIDGIAAGQAVVTALCWLIVTSVLGLTGLAVISVVILGASLGFLLHNLPPARIFMGDVGSTILGFTFATLPILAFNSGHDSRLFIVGASCVALFVFDTTLTMLRRAIRKDSLFQAHRTHLYQRLTKLGYVHGSVTGLYIAAGSISSILGLAYLWGNDLIAVVALLVIAILLVSMAAGITWLEHSRRGAN
jgi:UDP-N-acetylmuramyl pentapeptide phosphotransferase/UDP-N-acetylglucosamine-1-phosphate transferase